MTVCAWTRLVESNNAAPIEKMRPVLCQDFFTIATPFIAVLSPVLNIRPLLLPIHRGPLTNALILYLNSAMLAVKTLQDRWFKDTSVYQGLEEERTEKGRSINSAGRSV